MVRVSVRSFFTLKDILGDGDVRLKTEDSTIEGLLKALANLHGEKFRRQIFDEKTGNVKFYRVVVNGRQYNDMSTRLNDGDIIDLYPAMAGG